MSEAIPGTEAEIARQACVDFDEHVMYWHDHLASCPFYRDGLQFEDYLPAFKLGISSFLLSHGRTFGDMSEQLERTYERTRQGSRLDWPEVRWAASAAWSRMEEMCAHPKVVEDCEFRTPRPRRSKRPPMSNPTHSPPW